MRRFGLNFDPRTFNPGQEIGANAGQAIAQPRAPLTMLFPGQGSYPQSEAEAASIPWTERYTMGINNRTLLYAGGGLAALAAAWYFYKKRS